MFSKNAIIFGADIGLLVHTDKKKYILILSKSPANIFADTTLNTHKKKSINFIEETLFKFALQWKQELHIFQWC